MRKFLLISLGLVVFGCSAEQLEKTKGQARDVGAATTQPSITDLLPGGPTIKAMLGILAGGAVTMIGMWQKQKAEQKNTALTQVVKGTEQAFPTKTEDQKLKLAAAQDESTKAIVADVKKDLANGTT